MDFSPSGLKKPEGFYEPRWQRDSARYKYLKGITVDANIIYELVKEVADSSISGIGPIEALFENLLKKYGIALDTGIRTEWERTCGSPWYNEWYLDNLRRRRIQEVVVTSDSSLRKTLRVKYGMPLGSKDYMYVFCAKIYPPNYIVTEDVGLYDPKATSSPARKRAKARRDSSMCVFRRKVHNITVGTLQQCSSDLGF